MTLLEQIDSDISNVFLNTNDFAESATYTPNGGVAATVSVIFDEPYSGTNINTGNIETTEPAIFVKTSDYTLSHSDRFIVRGVSYKVSGIKPDGTGMTKITLVEV